jgi:hypothetical protein
MEVTSEALLDIVEARVKAKREEDAAVERRRALDQKIAQLVGGGDMAKEGTVSTKVGTFKVAVVFGMNRKVDTERLQSDWPNIPTLHQAFRWKAETNADFKKLEGRDAALAAKYVTATPSSPSVKVEV